MKRNLKSIVAGTFMCFVMGGAIFTQSEVIVKAEPVAEEFSVRKAEIANQEIELDIEVEIDENAMQRDEIVDYALQFLGNPYVYGGTSLTNGTDCSGFTMSIYKHFGNSIGRSSRDQVHDGKAVKASELQKGDLVFYANGGRINHVAMYIGNGKIVHASTPRTGIRIGEMNYRTPYKMVSILN